LIRLPNIVHSRTAIYQSWPNAKGREDFNGPRTILQRNSFVIEKLRRMCVYDMHGSACTSSVVLALNIGQLWKPTFMYYNIKYNNKMIRSMKPLAL